MFFYALRSLLVFLIVCFFTSDIAFAEEPWSLSSVGNDSAHVYSDIKREGVGFLQSPSESTGFDRYWAIGGVSLLGISYIVDSTISSELQSHRGHFVTDMADVASFVGSPYLHLGVASGLYLTGGASNNQKLRETGMILGEALILTDASSVVIKQVVGRARPRVTDHKSDTQSFGFAHDYDSFPSLHTASSFAMASVVAQRYDSTAVTVSAYSVAGLVGLARVTQGAHWLSDVVAGAMLGEIAGRVVTRYHDTVSSRMRVSILPAILNNGAGMTLLVQF